MKMVNDLVDQYRVYTVAETAEELVEGSIYKYTDEDGGYYLPFVKLLEPTSMVDAETIIRNQTQTGCYPYKTTDGNIEVAFILDPREKDMYSTEYWVIQYDNSDITDIINDVNSTDINSANNAQFVSSCGSNKFIPAFYQADNVLNTAMKTALVYKGINIELYRPKFTNTSDFNNNRRHFTDERYAPLSIGKFEKLCEIFDLDFDIVVRDKAESKNPMGREITVHSDGSREGADDIDMYIKFLRDGNEEEEETDEE